MSDNNQNQKYNDNHKRHRTSQETSHACRHDRLTALTPYEYWTRATERENRKQASPTGIRRGEREDAGRE